MLFQITNFGETMSQTFFSKLLDESSNDLSLQLKHLYPYRQETVTLWPSLLHLSFLGD